MVALDFGGYFCSDLAVSPGNGGRKPFCSAVSSVELAGDQSAPWAKATRSSGLADALTACMASCGMGISSSHSPRVE